MHVILIVCMREFIAYGQVCTRFDLHSDMSKKGHADSTTTGHPRVHAPLLARLEDVSDLVQDLLWGECGAQHSSTVV